MAILYESAERKKMSYKTNTLWPACILGIVLLLTGCGYFESKEEIAAWVKESLQATIQKDDAYKGISIGEVTLVRESPSKFTGYVEYKYGHLEKLALLPSVMKSLEL